MSYDNWRARLKINAEHSTVAARRAAIAALKINFSLPQIEDEGFYRKPITEPVLGADGKPNGQKRVVGWSAASYFLLDKQLVGIVGVQGRSRPMKPEEVTSDELWSQVVAHPIPHAWWVDVVENGKPWPDLPNNQPEEGKRLAENQQQPEPGAEDKPAEPADVVAARAIDAAISAAATLVVDSAESRAIADGSKNRIAELRLSATKQGEAIYKPLFDAYTAMRNRWLPMVNRADTAEKAIKRKILDFDNAELARKREAEKKAAEEQAAIDEANARAADRAIAQGLPEPAPEVPAEPVASTPAPARPAPTYGKRTTTGKLQKFAVIEDQAKVYDFFKTNKEVADLLEKLATNAIRAGEKVPGTKTDERLA